MRKIKYAGAAMLPFLAACQTPAAMPAVASASETSLCQVDRAVTYSVAPAADANDAGNKWDTDETVKALMAHNARLRAACPD